ncbi:MAG: hypothetical protein JNM88_04145 [Chitinophagaceae bacterium]|nr:hypothetical protein [Chitinophagaceae bacterium]
MKQANTATEITHSNSLQAVVTDNTDQQKKLQQLTDTAWSFACTALWNNLEFSSRETSTAKDKIRSVLQSGDMEKSFLAFCQRVLLARHYVSKNPGHYIPLPSVWLDETNKRGFAGTESWYNRVIDMRQSLPSYKQEVKALAEAILELSTEPSNANYQYWRSYFIDHRSPGLLTLFQQAAVQQLYH